MEAIILCGGKAERLGDAAGGRPKSLVDVAGKPLAAYQVGRLAKAGVDRVIISCAAGQGEAFEGELAGLGPEIVAAEEPERLGRGGGIKFASKLRQETGDVFALNGDELVAVDFEALLARHGEAGGAATVAVARPKSGLDVVDLGDGDVAEGFSRRWARLSDLGQLRRLHPLRRRRWTWSPGQDHDESTAVAGAHPGAPTLQRLPPRRALADREDAEEGERCRRPRRRACGVADLGVDLGALGPWGYDIGARWTSRGAAS